ncbi:hypothetical protein C8Q77DRAFT_813985 [Trametes polyzona]|nr:hypothetical protein C8Q77DRAFT_813985 [Trametes polyzona]
MALISRWLGTATFVLLLSGFEARQAARVLGFLVYALERGAQQPSLAVEDLYVDLPHFYRVQQESAPRRSRMSTTASPGRDQLMICNRSMALRRGIREADQVIAQIYRASPYEYTERSSSGRLRAHSCTAGHHASVVISTPRRSSCSPCSPASTSVLDPRLTTSYCPSFLRYGRVYEAALVSAPLVFIR